MGQRVFYNFELSEPNTRLYFDSLLNSANVLWSLSGPRGLVVADRRFDQSDSQNGTSIFELPPGSYTLTVDGQRDFTGDFAFRLLDLSQASPLTPGTPVIGALAPANRTDAYGFDAAAGESFFFQSLSTAGGPAYWRLLDPFGRSVWGPESFSTDVGAIELAFAGRYTLLVEGRRDAGGDIPTASTCSRDPVHHGTDARQRGQRQHRPRPVRAMTTPSSWRALRSWSSTRGSTRSASSGR